MNSLLVDNSILIVPNSIKKSIRNYIHENKKNINIKLFNLEEFIKKITYDFDEKTIYTLMNSENITYNISKLYLDNMKYVESSYDNYKLNMLFEVKNKMNKYLIKNNSFRNLIKNKKIIVYGYDYITKYQRYIFSSLKNIEYYEKNYNTFQHNVYHFDTLENEVIFVAESILDLIYKGIDINNIFIANLDSNYYSVIKRVFDMYNIPINLCNKKSLYQTKIGKYFIDNLNNNINDLMIDIESKFDMNIQNNKIIYNKIIDVINKFYFTNDYICVRENIINVMKNTNIDNTKYINAINEIDLYNNIIDDDKYIFLVGFNLNKIPVTVKDEDFITDNIKPDLLEKSYEMNIINKEIWFKIISNIKNLVITYKDRHLNESFYPSLLIEENNMNVIEHNVVYSKYSNNLNKILLSKSLDELIKFNIFNNNLEILFNNYKINYMSYDNRFSGLDRNNFYKFLDSKFNLSYSSMDNYYHCAFKFYLSNILKLDCYESTIQTYIGNLFHYVLSKAFSKDFNFDKCVKYFISNNEYEKNYKNDYYINKVLDELKFIIKSIEYQNTLINMNETYYEKKVNVEKNGVININFKGFIDKLLIKNNKAVIIDYKTYMVDINLNYLPYGLSMQLPVYLYLTKNINKDYEIIGFYLQQILFNKFNKNYKKTLKELKKDNLKLKGYSLGNESLLSEFDSTMNNSELIHGMKLTNKGFGPYSKVLTNKQIDNIVNIIDNKINECIDGITNAKFDINPKMINNKNIGCEYCKFKDICFMTNKDVKELDDIKDLNFLD